MRSARDAVEVLDGPVDLRERADRNRERQRHRACHQQEHLELQAGKIDFHWSIPV
jgi:hypothetical protein